MRCSPSHLVRSFFALVAGVSLCTNGVVQASAFKINPTLPTPTQRFAYLPIGTAISEYKWFLILVLVLAAFQTILITKLWLERRRRWRASDRLSESEERFSKAFRGNPQPMSLTRLEDGRYLDVNASFLMMSGYTRPEIIDHTSIELQIFSDETDRHKLLVEPLLTKGSVRNLEMDFRTKSGAYRTLLSSAELLDLAGEKCILVASSDISDRKTLEQDLRLSEREFSTLVENSPDIIARLDRNLRCIYISPALEKITNIPPETLIGRTPSEIALPGYDFKGLEACCLEAINTKTSLNRVFEYGHRTFSSRIIPELTPEGSVESLMTICEDVTERVRSEKELTDLTVRLFTIQDEERRRIARELHDSTAQNLFAISVNLAKLEQHTDEMNADQPMLVAESQLLVEQSLQEIRTLSYLLHPPLLDQVGLVSALQWYVQGFSKRSGIYIELFAQPIGRLPAEIEMALFRVVQEALTNVRKHSGSEIAKIRLERGADSVLLEISDRGTVFSQASSNGDSNSLVGMGVGIQGMRQRMRQLGGKLDINLTEHGTTISAVVPLTNGVNHGANTHSRRS